MRLVQLALVQSGREFAEHEGLFLWLKQTLVIPLLRPSSSPVIVLLFLGRWETSPLLLEDLGCVPYIDSCVFEQLPLFTYEEGIGRGALIRLMLLKWT